jgi:hypothetical protein
VTGFNALNVGSAHLFTLRDKKVIGATRQRFHVGVVRNVNNIGQPSDGLGVSLKSQGLVTGAGTPDIVVQSPKFEGVENIVSLRLSRVFRLQT